MTQKTLSVKLELLTTDFSKNLDKAVGKVLDSTKKMAKDISSLTAKLSLAISVPASLIGKSLLKMAGDAEDATDKFNAVFGDSAPKVQASIENLSKVFTRNTTDLKNYTSEFGSMLTSMDFTEREAGDLSRSMVQLGLDVASLRGVSDAKVMDAFTASLTGNVKALRGLGISISDTDMDNERFLLGIDKSIKDLSEREKALVMVSLMQKNFSKDVGDASNSQRDWGEVMNQFNAKLKNLGESLGKELIPQVMILIDKIAPLIEAFTNLDESTKSGIMSILLLSAIIPPITTAVSSFGGIIFDLAKAFWGLIGAIIPAIFAIVTFLSELAILALTQITTAVGLFSAEIILLTGALVAPVVIFGSLALILRALVKLIGFFTIAFGDYAQEITRAVIPVTLALLKSWEGLTYAMVYAKNAMKGHQEASNQARIATDDLRQSQKDLAEAFVTGAPTELGNKIQKSMHESGRAIEQLTDDVDSFFLFIPKKLGSVMDTTVSIMKSKGNELASSLKNSIVNGAVEGAKSLESILKAELKDIVKMIGSFDPFASLKTKKEYTNESFQGARGQDNGTEALTSPKDLVPPKTDTSALQGLIGGVTTAMSQAGSFWESLFAGGAEKVEEAKTLLDQWRDHITVTSESVALTMTSLYDQLSEGMSNAVNSMIFEGARLSDVMKALAVDMAKSIISALVKMAMQYIATAVTALVTAKTSAVGQITTLGAVTYAATFASISAIPIIGPMLAPGMATSAEALMLATALPKVALAEGGITNGPTRALIGEKGREAVVPLDRLESMQGQKSQTIIMNLDGRTLARSVIQNSPREIRISTGVTM